MTQKARPAGDGPGEVEAAAGSSDAATVTEVADSGGAARQLRQIVWVGLLGDGWLRVFDELDRRGVEL